MGPYAFHNRSSFDEGAHHERSNFRMLLHDPVLLGGQAAGSPQSVARHAARQQWVGDELPQVSHAGQGYGLMEEVLECGSGRLSCSKGRTRRADTDPRTSLPGLVAGKRAREGEHRPRGEDRNDELCDVGRGRPNTDIAEAKGAHHQEREAEGSHSDDHRFCGRRTPPDERREQEWTCEVAGHESGGGFTGSRR